ncbi:NACHT domain-containing protein [Streptomyces sp. 8N616]
MGGTLRFWGAAHRAGGVVRVQGLDVVMTRLATTVVSALAKSLLTKRPGAGLAEKPASPGGIGRRPARLSEKETGRLVDSLAGRLGEVCGEACSKAPEHERSAAVAAVGDVFSAAGPLDQDLLLELDLEPRELRDHVLARANGVRSGAALGEAGNALFDRLLDLCCLHIVEYASSLPTFPARSQVELVRRTGRTEQAVEEVRRRLGPGPAGEAARFESRYADVVVATHSRLQLFGVTLSGAGAEWALDTAYISLGVNNEAPETAFRREFAAPTVRIEQALADSSRLLLRGPAGSGKSTLVQWLATNAARRSFGTQLADWNACVPFVLRLRALGGRDALPLPQDFLTAMGNPLAGAAPVGWAEDLLSSGRALVLVDGVDEVPQRLRKRTEDWLRTMVAAFPDARYVVTTRPSAVPEDWLAQCGFRARSLLPMTREDARSFITHWHDAARQECGPGGDREALDTYEESLLQAVGTRRELGRLSTNPLMCALLCALNRDRRMHLPRARKELYDAALDMLLVRRDTEREIAGVEGVELTKDEQTLLLQQLAYWLIRNGQVEAECGEAIEMIDESLAAMPQVRQQGSAEQVFRHLLIRSGLLREPVPGSVGFVHRTFQDHLAAKAAVEARDFGFLVGRAHDDQWEDVIRMAVGHARPAERVRLLRGILKRADRVKLSRNRLNLLAAACLEHAPQLDPEVRGEVEGRLAELIPPWNDEEAEELAKAGELVLDLLPGPENVEDEWSARAVVRTAALIGGTAAMALIARFCGDERVRVAVTRAWSHFDTHAYIDAVLSRAALRGVFLTVDSQEQMEALPRLPQVNCVTANGDLQPFDHLGKFTESLHIIRNRTISDLSFVQRFPALRGLSLTQCPEVADLAPLEATSIETLRLQGLYPWLSLAPLRPISKLTRLDLDFEVPMSSLESLPVGPQLTGLGLYNMAVHVRLHGMERWPHLNWLTLTGERQGSQLALLEGISQLELLQLRFLSDLDLEDITSHQRLGTLWLVGCTIPRGLAPLQDLPLLADLLLSACQGPDTAPLDLAPLAEMPNLVISITGGTKVLNADLIPPERLVTPGPPRRVSS